MKKSEYLMKIQKKNVETSREKSRNFRIIFQKRKSPLWRNLKIWWKFGKSGKNLETGKKPEKYIIISYLPSKLSIMWRNMVKTIEIWKFEKSHKTKKNQKKKVIFKLLSFAHESVPLPKSAEIKVSESFLLTKFS